MCSISLGHYLETATVDIAPSQSPQISLSSNTSSKCIYQWNQVPYEMKQHGWNISCNKKSLFRIKLLISRSVWSRPHWCNGKGQKVPLQMKQAANERKEKLWPLYRKCWDKENEDCHKTAAIVVLAEDRSLRSYQQNRLLQCFETPPSKK